MSARLGISGSTLKWIAIITMAIDHVGAALLEAFVLNAWGGSPLGGYFGNQWDMIYGVDWVLRQIGRIAFPIYCFLLTEGFVHTRDVKKYAIRLGAFALISEIPFDLALRITPFDWEHQNVFFTLLIGLLVIWFIQPSGRSAVHKLLGLLGGCFLAELLHTDYGAFGILLIVMLYLTREERGKQCILGACLSLWEKKITTPLAFIPIYFYNGIRGRQPKWFFYWFYPVHLLLYYMIGAQVLPAVLL